MPSRTLGSNMISRRVFLKNGGVRARQPRVRAVVSGADGVRRRAASAASKQLIAIFQRGAVDGLSVVVPFGESRLLPRAAEHRDCAAGRGRRRGARSRRLLRIQPAAAAAEAVLGSRAQLAIVHACGSPDATRSHFDAQDYMETATPGVKSTSDGWLNRYLQARARRSVATPFRAVALTPQLPRMLQGTAPALAMNQIGAVRHSRRPDGDEARRSRRSIAAAADRVLNGTGREAFDAIKMLKVADPSRYQPENGADYPRSPFGQALKQIAQLTKADVGLEVAFADVGGWDTHVNQGVGARSAREPARRFRAKHRGARHRPRRPHGGHRRAHDVGVRPRGERERQPRHRSRPRQRDDGHRRRRARRPGLRQVARPCAGPSATKAAISRSRPTSATSSAKSSSRHWASSTRARSSPATPCSPSKFPGLFAKTPVFTKTRRVTKRTKQFRTKRFRLRGLRVFVMKPAHVRSAVRLHDLPTRRF